MPKSLREDGLLRIAHNFVRSYVSDRREVLGVLLVGSSTIGVFDKFADIDLMVFSDNESVKKRKAEGKGYGEEYFIEGVEVCVDWHDIETFEKMIEAQIEDWYLWIVSNSKILYDPFRRLRKGINGLKPHSLELKRRKVFKQYYFLRARANDMKKCVERGEHEAASILCYQALDHFTKLLFLLEGKYVPYEKWRFHEMRRLQVGEIYLPEIRQVLCISCLEKEELLKKVQILERIIQSANEQLLKLGIPVEWVGEEWWKQEPDWEA